METISFEDLGLDELTLAAVGAKGFESPTPIQILAIPRLLNGDANVIAKARTGTGKTAAFGLPLVQTIREDKGRVQALVLTPTRELALQVCKEIESFTKDGFPRLTPVYGGQFMGEQRRALRNGCEIVVGTPGRIKDHIERGSLKLEHIDYFVLDEADEMLDMGFIEDIEFIFSKANPESRILLFSATMPPPILKIAAAFMGDYEIVEEETGPEEPLLTEQIYWFVRESEKIEALVRMIDSSPDFYGLVFTQTKADADSVSKLLDERGYEAAALHGDIPQAQREKILSRFRSKKTRILVATDVAARGIDIEGLTHVVNYALPFDGPTYVHRIGRTGRAGAKGLAFTLVKPEERRRLEFLKQSVRKAIKGEMREASVPSVREVLNAKRLRLFTELKESKAVQAVPQTPEAFPQEREQPLPSTEAEIAGEDTFAAENAGDNVTGKAAASAINFKRCPADKLFAAMAQDLCTNRNAEDVLAAVLENVLGAELDPERYGTVTAYKPPVRGSATRGTAARGGKFSGGKSVSAGAFGGRSDQIRLYVGLGRKDGFNAREIAEYFSGLLNIPQRLVDRIDVSAAFSLVSLPVQAGRDALERSRRDKTLPHMHIDVKEGGFAEDDGFSKKRGAKGSSFKRGKNAPFYEKNAASLYKKGSVAK
ncbi:DEAD/DEAH box helicase [Treponema sp. HNW]|uniref:DEAD/DEAH box helicase n=1 Tax=Treponema sp. HNW TaxID=3116654 RepID=UPI003D118E20